MYLKITSVAFGVLRKESELLPYPAVSTWLRLTTELYGMTALGSLTISSWRKLNTNMIRNDQFMPQIAGDYLVQYIVSG